VLLSWAALSSFCGGLSRARTQRNSALPTAIENTTAKKDNRLISFSISRFPPPQFVFVACNANLKIDLNIPEGLNSSICHHRHMSIPPSS
jgi:hypothetical protein